MITALIVIVAVLSVACGVLIAVLLSERKKPSLTEREYSQVKQIISMMLWDGSTDES